MTSTAEWTQIDAALDALLVMPKELRLAAVEQLTTDASVRAELRSLLGYMEEDQPSVLDGTALDCIATPPGAVDTGELQVGARVGAYRVISLLGRGGMGEVYKAERVGVDFRQIVALKLVSSAAVSSAERFQIERQILAELDHAGIARLLDGGITEAGRPYMAMELVDGHDLMTHCASHRCSLAERLTLFDQICAAVAHAHAHLVVHRDLKPGNIFVTTDGRIKLLDFGIAKLLNTHVVGDATRTAHLSPAYAAPEQLTGAPVTTATDIYGLGAILYQLLSGQTLREVSRLPFAAALQQILHAPLLPPSQAIKAADWPIQTRQIQGDLDAIIAVALRREPEARYSSVQALVDDIARYKLNEPVRARSGARAYVVRRFLRRHWKPLAAAASIVLLLIAGVAGVTWQWTRAQKEAQRATAIKDFLMSVFNASDPRVAQDKPRGQITAKELLDLSAGRIEKEFGADPDLQIELLGSVGAIYRELDEVDQYHALQRRQVELARKQYGEPNTVEIGALLDQADDAVDKQDYVQGLKLLDQADQLIHRAKLDRSVWRARYWLSHGQALEADASRAAERTADLKRAVDYFASQPTPDAIYVTALNHLAGDYVTRGDYRQGIAGLERAVAIAQRLPHRNDGELSAIYANLAFAQQLVGDYTGATESYERSSQIIRQTYGERNPRYWVNVANHARMLHARGERDRPLRMFAGLMKLVPPPAERNHDAAEVREEYGAALYLEGRPDLAIAQLEAAEQGYLVTPQYFFELARARLRLGVAYDWAGRSEDARRALQEALRDYSSNFPADSQAVLVVRERWADFLLDQGEIAAAEAQYREVISQARGHRWAPAALSQQGLGRVALRRQDPSAALRFSRDALQTLEHVEGVTDVRYEPGMWNVYAQALLASGDATQANLWARKAVEADTRYDDPASAELASARATLHSTETALAPPHSSTADAAKR